MASKPSGNRISIRLRPNGLHEDKASRHQPAALERPCFDSAVNCRVRTTGLIAGQLRYRSTGEMHHCQKPDLGSLKEKGTRVRERSGHFCVRFLDLSETRAIFERDLQGRKPVCRKGTWRLRRDTYRQVIRGRELPVIGVSQLTRRTFRQVSGFVKNRVPRPCVWRMKPTRYIIAADRQVEVVGTTGGHTATPVRGSCPRGRC